MPIFTTENGGQKYYFYINICDIGAVYQSLGLHCMYRSACTFVYLPSDLPVHSLVCLKTLVQYDPHSRVLFTHEPRPTMQNEKKKLVKTYCRSKGIVILFFSFLFKTTHSSRRLLQALRVCTIRSVKERHTIPIHVYRNILIRW